MGSPGVRMVVFSSVCSCCSIQCQCCDTDVSLLTVMLSAQYKQGNSEHYPSVTALPGLSVRTDPAQHLMPMASSRHMREGLEPFLSLSIFSTSSSQQLREFPNWRLQLDTHVLWLPLDVSSRCVFKFISILLLTLQEQLFPSCPHPVWLPSARACPAAWQHVWSPALAPSHAVRPRASLQAFRSGCVAWHSLSWAPLQVLTLKVSGRLTHGVLCSSSHLHLRLPAWAL